MKTKINHKLIKSVWSKVLENHEDLNVLTIKIGGEYFFLKKHISQSGEVISFATIISNENIEYFGSKPSKTAVGCISFTKDKGLIVSNGNKSSVHICLSLVTIL